MTMVLADRAWSHHHRESLKLVATLRLRLQIRSIEQARFCTIIVIFGEERLVRGTLFLLILILHLCLLSNFCLTVNHRSIVPLSYNYFVITAFFFITGNIKVFVDDHLRASHALSFFKARSNSE